MTAYYNEFDPIAAQWLRNLISKNLIAPGDVDERSIEKVKANEIKKYTQCHFFAGIGGWSAAIRIAGGGVGFGQSKNMDRIGTMSAAFVRWI